MLEANRAVIQLIYAETDPLTFLTPFSRRYNAWNDRAMKYTHLAGEDGLKTHFAATLRVLKPGGREVWRDFAKPEHDGPVLLHILDTEGN